MAEVIRFEQAVRERRRATERGATRACCDIIETNLRLALYLFSAGPETERPVRARQVRQLAELLEYTTRAGA